MQLLDEINVYNIKLIINYSILLENYINYKIIFLKMTMKNFFLINKTYDCY